MPASKSDAHRPLAACGTRTLLQRHTIMADRRRKRPFRAARWRTGAAPRTSAEFIMSIRSLVALVVVLVLGIFVAANWTAFTAPTSLSLIAGTVEAPLGIVMLGITGAIAALFLAYAFYLQASASRESRRLSRDVQAQRDLADRAEASRLTELRSALETRLDRLSGASSALQQSLSGVAAELAELNDRIGSAASTSLAPGKPARTDAGETSRVTAATSDVAASRSNAPSM
jgi:uncharacterized integral membrane protein